MNHMKEMTPVGRPFFFLMKMPIIHIRSEGNALDSKFKNDIKIDRYLIIFMLTKMKPIA